MPEIPAGTDRATQILVRATEPYEGAEEPHEFVVGAAYLEAFPDEVEFVRFADETPEAAEAREKKQAAAETDAEAAAKSTAKTSSGSGSGGSGRSDF